MSPEHPRSTSSTRQPLIPSAAVRLWNHVLVGLTRRPTEFVYSADYQVDLGITPIDSLRPQKILTYLLSQSMVGAKSLLRPEPASIRDLELAHAHEYLNALRQPSTLIDIVGFEVWPDLHEQLLQAQRAAVGGTMLATHRALRDNSILVNLGGGFHHASRSRGGGFCVFNDVAVAILQLRQSGFDKPILVVDLDLHDGNGTREIFAEDESVFTFSIHNRHWSREPAEASLSIELTQDVDDRTYMNAIHDHLPVLMDRVQPALIYYLAGTDPASDDAMGNWKISARAMLERDCLVVSGARDATHQTTPIVVVLAGGYGQDTWRYSARFFAWLLTNSRRREPPTTNEMTLARYRHLLQFLETEDRPSLDSLDWGLSESDITGDLGATGGPSLFLGRFSRHALELAMEWTGLFDRLRSRGFYRPHLDVDLGHPNGHTLRLYTDSLEQELLIEVRLRIERNLIPETRLLSIEWLLMQNPRASFSATRPPLPQQTHPGLGLVPDVISLLILLCDRLELDGLVFIPSHFHLVRKAGKHLHFLRPEDRLWFEAVEKALRGLPLAKATAIVAEGGLRDRATGDPVLWRTMPMVLAVSESFADRLELEKSEQAKGASAQHLEFEIAADPSAQ